MMEPGSLLRSAARQREAMAVNCNWGVSSQIQGEKTPNDIIIKHEVTSGVSLPGGSQGVTIQRGEQPSANSVWTLL